jgi:pimeloyl-ACP methyl ester carboxylesterase
MAQHLPLARALAVLVPLCALPACGGDPAPPDQPAPITWGACPEAYAGAECATVSMPLDHDHPEGRKLDLLVARKLSGKPGAPQLWMLNGGPGSSGQDFFYGMVDTFAQAMPGVDIYVPDHRGTGSSGYLGCAGEDPASPGGNLITAEEWPACAEQVKKERAADLPFLTVTAAARDVGALIERTRASGQQVFVYGLSYGTTLALRYLHLFPDQATGVILDSVVSPGDLFVSRQDQSYDPVAKKYAALCQADATCAAKMGPDPWARIASVFDKIDAGHCAEAKIDRQLLRRILAETFIGFRGRLLSLALPYRLDRCAPEDLVAIEQFKSVWLAPYDLLGFSQALEVHIDFSEIWESPAPSAAELQARADAALYSLNWASDRAAVYESWPKYPADQYALAWPKATLPMLMLNGTLDPQTPIESAQIAATHFNGPHQTFVTLPNVPHVASYQSPVIDAGALPCGVQVIASFVGSPEGTPDTACLARIKPVAFEDAKLAKSFFGTGSVWENIAP